MQRYDFRGGSDDYRVRLVLADESWISQMFITFGDQNTSFKMTDSTSRHHTAYNIA